MRLQIGILASGSGSNAEAIMEAAKEGKLNAQVKLIFTNKANAGVIERAKKYNIPYFVLEHNNFNSREEFDAKMVEVLQEYECDTIAMAGFMRLVTPIFINAFRGRILNVHPAILPSFKGAHGIEDARNYGVKIFGCSVHFVDEIMDNGEIIIQAALPAEFESEEEARSTEELLHKLEHKIYIQALKWLSEERLEIIDRKVKLHKEHKIVPQFPIENVLIYPFLED